MKCISQILVLKYICASNLCNWSRCDHYYLWYRYERDNKSSQVVIEMLHKLSVKKTTISISDRVCRQKLWHWNNCIQQCTYRSINVSHSRRLSDCWLNELCEKYISNKFIYTLRKFIKVYILYKKSLLWSPEKILISDGYSNPPLHLEQTNLN